MLDENWRKTFAPIGVIPSPGKWIPTGACVFIRYADFVWCATAAHVVGDQPVGCFVSLNGAQTILCLTDIYKGGPQGIGWIKDAATDLAVAPLPTPPGIDIKAIDESLWIPLARVVPSMPCLTAGHPYGIPGVAADQPTPLILDGVIAGLDKTNRRLFFSTPTFPGNSGGPAIVYRNPFTMDGGNITIGGPTVFLAGIVTDTILVPNNQAEAKKQIPPLHLGCGASIDALKALLSGSVAQKMLATLHSLPAPK